jgi:hypothetical protein
VSQKYVCVGLVESWSFDLLGLVSVVVIASESVWVASQFSLDFFFDDILVAVKADSAGWWTWSTSWTQFTIWTWWTLSAWNTVYTWWTILTL